ncbi:cleft lip and palate transmembrane protein 1-domain-containing protein [Paraphysoderma sedebokerense]|nr:cleft lip and palate transmembrane protein 1-domain-containing protein [Paraphysoderma sedebokerense]
MSTAAPATGSQTQQPQQQGGFGQTVATIGRFMLIYYLINSFLGGQPAANITSKSAKDKPTLSKYINWWPLDSSIDLYLYINDSPSFTKFNDPSTLIWTEKSMIYGDLETFREKRLDLAVPESAKRNGSIWAHIYVTKNGRSPNPVDSSYSFQATIYKKYQLNKYLQQKKEVQTKNLLDSADGDHVQQRMDAPNIDGPPAIISYWTGNLTLNLVADKSTIDPRQLPPHVTSHMQLQTPSTPDATHGYYFPILYINEFWLLERKFTLINETVETVPLYLSYYPLTMWKYQLYTTMSESFNMQKSSFGASSSEIDEIKRMFVETNPYFLGLTMFVSLLHSVFDFLAFKNDIQFWRNKEDVHGISVRSILLNVFFQIVIFLYLFDNQRDTSYMILVSSGIGLLIEIWKAKKAVNVNITWNGPIPKFKLENKVSYTKSKTKEYDDIAFRYLSWVLYPAVIGYAVYSLIYDKHKSWYSFVLNTLVGFVYTFGFIMQTPQLFINYKLKSVAHMNGRVLTYKFLNTIVDDLFAFIVSMPTLHRLAAFRDDVIFVIYMYQRWKYPVDKTRMNEFGQRGENDTKTEADKPSSESSTNTDIKDAKGPVSDEIEDTVESKKDK